MNAKPGRTAWVVACAFLSLAAGGWTGTAAGSEEEDRLITVLRSDRSANEKMEACKRLRIMGTSAAVPALAVLLGDAGLSICARHALDAMSCPEAGAALERALAGTEGAVRVGIIDSLGERREAGSVAVLEPFLGHADDGVVSAAAAALGKIGGARAVRALQSARASAPAAARPAVAEALLRCADRLLGEGDRRAAWALSRALSAKGEPPHVRTAAQRIAILAGRNPAGLASAALKGDDGPAVLAALMLVPEIEGTSATMAFAALVPGLPEGTQTALVEALSRRGDPLAERAVAAAAKSPSRAVRVAALKGLGTLGGAASVGVLAEAAAGGGDIDERKTARASLARLRGDGVRAAILAELLSAGPGAVEELARALGARAEKETVPELLATAARADRAGVRIAVSKALGELADDSAVPAMVDLLVRAEGDAERKAAEAALRKVCLRSNDKERAVAPVLAGLRGATVPARCALLRVAGRAGGASVLRALRGAARDPDESVRDVAVRTLAETGGLDAAPELLRLATEAQSPVHRVLALRGYWRVVKLAGGEPVEERLEMCRAGLAVSKRTDEKRLGLAELADVAHPEALRLAKALLTDKDVRSEAEVACVGIASGLIEPHLDGAKAVLRRLGDGALDETTRSAAKRTLSAMESDVDVEYINTWLIAGPYRRAGKECAALYDIEFPPEKHGMGTVAWRFAPPPADPALGWQVDLGDVTGGDHCIVYVKARVLAPRAQKVRLDIGTDDGVKLWVNGRLVHANNAIRGIRRDEDRAEAELRRGANEFLLKVTQHTLGCAAAVAVRNPDGSPIKGLRCH